MIDTSRMNELRAEVGDEDLLLILSAFFEEARAMTDALPLASEPERDRLLHCLRSGALNMGLAAVAEAAAAERANAPVADLTEGIDHALRATRSTIDLSPPPG